MSVSSLLNHTADIYRPSNSIDSEGGAVLSMGSVLYDDLPCLVQSAKQEVKALYSQRDLIVNLSLYWADSSKVLNIKDRVVYGGNNYRVVGLDADLKKSTWFRADLISEQGG